eukprot:763308-Hanusia_phi.AAC.2
MLHLRLLGNCVSVAEHRPNLQHFAAGEGVHVMRSLPHDLQEALPRLDQRLRPLLPHHLRQLDESAADDVEDGVAHDVGLPVLTKLSDEEHGWREGGREAEIHLQVRVQDAHVAESNRGSHLRKLAEEGGEVSSDSGIARKVSHGHPSDLLHHLRHQRAPRALRAHHHELCRSH